MRRDRQRVASTHVTPWRHSSREKATPGYEPMKIFDSPQATIAIDGSDTRQPEAARPADFAAVSAACRRNAVARRSVSFANPLSAGFRARWSCLKSSNLSPTPKPPLHHLSHLGCNRRHPMVGARRFATGGQVKEMFRWSTSLPAKSSYWRRDSCWPLHPLRWRNRPVLTRAVLELGHIRVQRSRLDHIQLESAARPASTLLALTPEMASPEPTLGRTTMAT